MTRAYRRYKVEHLLPDSIINPARIDLSCYATVEQAAKYIGVSRCHAYKILHRNNSPLRYIRTPLGILVEWSSMWAYMKMRRKAAEEKYAAYKAQQAAAANTPPESTDA